MRHFVLCMALAMLASACSFDTAQSTTTTEPVAEPATTQASTTTTQATPTTEGVTVLSAGRTVALDPGTDYSIDEFLVPVGFRVEEEGWRWYGVGEDWLYLGWISEGELAAALAVLAYRTGLPLDEVADAIVSIDGVELLSGPEGMTIAGSEALALDVEGAPRRAQANDNVCTGDETIGRFFIDEPGHPLVEGALPFYYGIDACKPSRVWVVEVGNRSITLVGGTTDPDRFDQLISVVERLFDSMTFEAP